MTHRGRGVLALGVAVYVVAWIFGARALYPVATGLVLAVVAAAAWVRLSSSPPHVARHGAARDVQENEDVRVEIELERTSALPPPLLVAHERIGRLGARDVELRRRGGRYVGVYELERVPRGRHPFDAIRVTVEDPFGLARGELVQGEQQALVVYPCLVELDRLFSEGGAHAQEGRRLLLRRPSGFDLHSVRDYVEGDSLRSVHWRTTARRGRLMVKELEDAPRDEVAVLLDGHVSTAAAAFDVAVRAAGSILLAHVRRERRCVLVLNSARRETQPVTSPHGWRRALELLAAAEADGSTPTFALLDAQGGVVARSLELVVVTARIDVPLVDRLVQRGLSNRGVSLVYVDAAHAPQPQLLRLQASGVPVAIVRPGTDLAAALSASELRIA